MLRSTVRLFLAAATALLLLLTGLSGTSSAATAVMSAVSMRAPVFSTYDHETGGGAWNNGSVTYVKGELLGTNYKCGDWATFMLKLDVAASPTMTPPPYTARVSLDFSTDATGQSGVGLQPSTDPSHLRVNSGVIANGAGTGPGGSDAGFVPSGSGLTTTAATSNGGATITQNGTFFTSGSYARLVFDVSNLYAGTSTIVRSDAQIKCKPYSSPTGNMQVSLPSISIVSPGNESVSAGAQTVNFRGVGNLGGLGVPVLDVIKTVADVTGEGSPTCPATPSTTTSITSTVTPTDALFCFYVSNYGTADATNVTLNDVDSSGSHPIALTGLTGSSLAAGATATGSYGPITFNSGGVFTDTATVSSDGGTVSATADATVRIENGVVLTKTVVEYGELCAGTSSLHLVALATSQLVTYCYNVTNYTSYTVDILSLVDDLAGIGSPASLNLFADLNYSDATSGTGITTLAPYATATSAYVQTFAAGDQTGTKTNIATLTYSDEGSHETEGSASVEFETPTAQLTVNKEQSGGGTPDSVGDVITYTITAENTGDIALTSVSISDDNAIIGACDPVIPVASLATGAAITCSATHTVTQADIDNGEVANTAIATGTPVGGVPTEWPSPEVIVPVTQAPELTVVKSRTSSAPSEVGESVSYLIVATNTGNVTLTAVSITDSSATIGTCTPAIPVASLAVNASVSCPATRVVTQADVDAGELANTAEAAATPPGGTPFTEESNEIVDPLTPDPELTVNKVRTSGATAALGSTVTYDIVATNTGNVTLSSVTVGDPTATITGCSPSLPVATLAVGASITCEASYVVTLDDVLSGSISNVATATGTPPGGGTVEGESPEVVTPIDIRPELRVTIAVIEPVPPSLPAGSIIRYRFQVRNTGNVPLSNVTPRPVNFVVESCDPPVGTTLQPGETMECIGSHVVTPEESAGKQVDVSVSATGIAPDGQEVVDLDPALSVLVDSLPSTGAETLPVAALGLVTLGIGGGLTYMSGRSRRRRSRNA